MARSTASASIDGLAIAYEGRGGPEVIRIITRSTRPPGPGEIRIAVHAAAVNPTDILMRQRQGDDANAIAIPGMDAAGTVESVGEGVTRLCVGDHVMAVVMPRLPDGGAQAQYIVVPEASVVPIPAGASFAEACTLPMNGMTALLALDHAQLNADQVLAVSGGAGTLASYAIAIAGHHGVRVIADASAADAESVRGYGASTVVDRGEGFAQRVREAAPHGVDALLDTAVLGEAAWAALRDGGTYIPVRGWQGGDAARHIQIKPVFVHEVMQRTAWLQALRGMAEQGVLTLRVAEEYPAERVADAQGALERGGLRGRPVIRFA